MSVYTKTLRLLNEQQRRPYRRSGGAEMPGLRYGKVLTRATLVEFRTRALRRRVWFRVLQRIERGLVDLTIRWVDTVKSLKLRQVLTDILVKLTNPPEHTLRLAVERGRVMAARLGDLAESWGYAEASEWRNDLTFQLTLGRGLIF